MLNMTRKKSMFLPIRNEGKIKEYDSCSDNEAWSHDPVKRAQYLREWIKRNTFKCILPASLLAKVLTGLEAKSKTKTKKAQSICCCGDKCKALLVFKKIGLGFSEEEKKLGRSNILMENSRQLETLDNHGKPKAKSVLSDVDNLPQALIPAVPQSYISCNGRCIDSRDSFGSKEDFLWNKIKSDFSEDTESDGEDLKIVTKTDSPRKTSEQSNSPTFRPNSQEKLDDHRQIKAESVLSNVENLSEALLPEVPESQFLELKDFPEDTESVQEDLKTVIKTDPSCNTSEESHNLVLRPISVEPTQDCKCYGTEDPRPLTSKAEKETNTIYFKYSNDSDPEVIRDDNTDAIWHKIQKCIPEAKQATDLNSHCYSSQKKNEAERNNSLPSVNESMPTKKSDEKIKLCKREKCINLVWQKQTKKRARNKLRTKCSDGDNISDKQRPVKSEVNIVMKVCSNEFENIAYIQIIHKERKCLPTKRSPNSKYFEEKKGNPLKILLKVRQAFHELIEREVSELKKSNKP